MAEIWVQLYPFYPPQKAKQSLNFPQLGKMSPIGDNLMAGSTDIEERLYMPFFRCLTVCFYTMLLDRITVLKRMNINEKTVAKC